MNIYQKLVEVRKSIEGWDKDTKGYGYSYVSGSQVLGKIKSKMDELGIILETHIETFSHGIHEYVNAKGKSVKDFVVNGQMLMVWVNADDPEDKIEVPWHYAGQQDDISKAFGSGLTYTERYFMLKQFGVPTDYDDPDKKEPQAPITPVKPTTPTTPPVKPSTPPPSNQGEPKTDVEAKNYIVETGANKGKPVGDLQDFQLKWLIEKSKNPSEKKAAEIVFKSSQVG